MHREKRMNESDRAIVRACLQQIVMGMNEARQVRTWWTVLSEEHRQEWKDFTESVFYLRRCLDERVEIRHID